MNLNIVIADYSNKKHGKDIVYLLDYFALDSAGCGTPLKQYVKENLIKELAQLSFAFSILC